eukprot:CAMPEP_0171094052 /NCGR_PEP_ID=MMETSP0766_2-20121228/39726_1 /TAXON_ID=439317 /ORGANISM="Gambierdiscus australes, Strain CAWD 149" /LENGTH=35 /DNA_ID= /DNA_START= /DNA_END= /DNA_ORIENTATION=
MRGSWGAAAPKRADHAPHWEMTAKGQQHVFPRAVK